MSKQKTTKKERKEQERGMIKKENKKKREIEVVAKRDRKGFGLLNVLRNMEIIYVTM